MRGESPQRRSSDDEEPSEPPSSSDTVPPAVRQAERPASFRERIAETLDLIRANPTGRFALRVSIATAGAMVVAIGLALVPLPGPGWLIVILGLSIWAIEFAWAKNLLLFTRRNLQGWTRWVGRQSWPIRIGLGVAGLIFVAVVVWLSVKFSFGIDLAQSVWNYVTTH
jgi:uncharacterized protein (TIGR02611 family)